MFVAVCVCVLCVCVWPLLYCVFMRAYMCIPYCIVGQSTRVASGTGACCTCGWIEVACSDHAGDAQAVMPPCTTMRSVGSLLNLSLASSGQEWHYCI